MAKASRESGARYRVVQWATGNIGTRSLQAIIEHPDMELVGLLVHSAAKEGKDAGELCGLGPIGVKATRSIDEIIALHADCIIHMPQGCNMDEVCRLLESGTNIVTTRGEFINPAWMDPAVRIRVEEACRRGNSSIHSTGSSPGFITEAIPLVLTSISRRLDCLTIDEFADCTSRDSPEMLFDVMGFGRTPAGCDEGLLHTVREHFGPSLSLLADAISLPLDSIEVHGELGAVRNTTRIAAGVLEAGTVGAHRITVSGMRNGRAVLRFRANWYCSTDIDKSWNLRANGWHVLMEGDTPLEVVITQPIPTEDMGAVTPGYTAHRPVNAIPFVCAAEPGIRTTVDLPQIIASLK